MQLAPRIVATADTCSGHARVEGTRVRVSHVLGWLASGMSPDEIVRDYPYIKHEDIRACLEFAQQTLESQPAPAK